MWSIKNDDYDDDDKDCKHLQSLITCWIPGQAAGLNASTRNTYLILLSLAGRCCYYPHGTNEETEA